MHVVAVVGGSRDFADLLALELEDQGFAVVRTADQADVVIVAGRTDHEEGTELLAEVRRRRPGAPVVFLTGKREAVQPAYAAGATLVILKPFELRELVRALQELERGEVHPAP